jgi:hypothetical protein
MEPGGFFPGWAKRVATAAIRSGVRMEIDFCFMYPHIRDRLVTFPPLYAGTGFARGHGRTIFFCARVNGFD